MSNLSPFEIRLELLKMAREMLEGEYYQKLNPLQEKYVMECDTANRKGLPIPDMVVPPFPTEQDVIAKATILNTFVSKG